MNTRFRAPRIQDLLLVALFVAMATITPHHDTSEIVLVLLIGALQITESRFIHVDTARAKIAWNVAKLVASYLLIGITDGVQSPFYWVLLFPVISAALTLGVISTLVFTGLACASYASFLLYVDWTQFDIHQDQIEELIRRLLFLAISGFLVNTFAEALREQSVRYKALADELALTNRNLREAEKQVRRAERLAALGQLTAGLAHELRNPLGTIKASADMLEQSIAGEGEIARELSGYISSEVDRTNSLVSRFLDFARPLQLRRGVADLSDVLAAAARATRLEAETHGVSVSVTDAGPLAFSFDAELLERVFVNLIINAIQASERGSEVLVQSEQEDNQAIVKVIDHGEGIDPERKEAIFNPFFTTKAAGTGLGLAIVAKIVDEHGGKIVVESDPGKGSMFTVTLPLSADS